MGANVSAGVGEGMKTYDFSSDASLLAAALEAAVGMALPQSALAPYGTVAIQGMANAMTSYSMSGTGSAIAASVRSSVNNSLNSGTLRSAGVNAMAGLKAGHQRGPQRCDFSHAVGCARGGQRGEERTQNQIPFKGL